MAKNVYVFLFILLLLFALISFPGCGGGEATLPEDGVFKVRHEYKELSESDVKSMIKSIGFYDRRWNRTGGFPNQFEDKTIDGQMVIIDRSTELTWHQSGSVGGMVYLDAVKWVENLNKIGYAGYNDWRLPTIEEALTLLERETIENYHIDAKFSPEQFSCWTGDQYTEVRMWAISFNYGRVFKGLHTEFDYVRPVRTGIEK